jgi:DNA-directed RNA polymerase subunit RPC12/RpoP
LQYLAFECFEQDIDEQRLHQLATCGTLAFQDYAVAKWGHHLRAMVDVGQSLLSDHPDNVSALHNVEIAMDDFTNRYESETLLATNLPAADEACKGFVECDFHENLLSIWSHISRHQAKGPEFRNEVSLKDLAHAFTRNRNILEELPLSNLSAHFETFYGDKRFKCPKVTCHYFHEGFKDVSSRQMHINRHDRPFNCTVADCFGADSGFSSNKDLEKHVKAYHFELSDLAEKFKSKKVVTNRTPFKCVICGQAFTRKLHKDSHERSHRGERPYACDECGRAFTRSNDMRRHKKIHTRR